MFIINKRLKPKENVLILLAVFLTVSLAAIIILLILK